MKLPHTLAIAAAVALLALACRAQRAPAFDVASFKLMTGPCNPQLPCTGDIRTEPTGLSTHGCLLGALIRWAYGKRIEEPNETIGPNWMEPGLGMAHYDIEAKTGHPVSVADLRMMLRGLLAERLKLALHRETRETSVYVLSVAKGGPKLRLSQDQGEPMYIPAPQLWGVWRFERVEFSRLHEFLWRFVPHLVVDETGLEGRYDFELNMGKFEDMYVPPPPHTRADFGAVLNRAFHEVGLSLLPAKRPVEVLVIDHVERTPTAN